MATGVYAILCSASGKLYVGSASVSISKRWADHRSALRFGKHHNRYLRAAWNLHGEGSFLFFVLEECEPAQCIPREQFWIDHLHSADRAIGYNLRPNAGNNLGHRHTEEARANMSAALSRRVRRKESYDKIAAVLRGRKHSPEVCAYMSQCQKGKHHSEATKAKMSATRKGRKYSEAHRKAISEGHRRRSEERKAAKLADVSLLPFMLDDTP